MSRRDDRHSLYRAIRAMETVLEDIEDLVLASDIEAAMIDLLSLSEERTQWLRFNARSPEEIRERELREMLVNELT
jgi:hypothetical protein